MNEGLKRWIVRVGPLVLALAAIFAFFSFLMAAKFANSGNVETILRQSAIVATAALGMTLVIVSGGIDLSVGSIVAFSTVIIAWLLKSGVPPLPAALGGVAGGALCGLVSGTLITRIKLVPFIVTLGMYLIIRGAAKGVANEKSIYVDETWLNKILAALTPDKKWMLLPPGVWLMLALAALTAWVLTSTRFGRHVSAIGSNEATARLCGVSVNRVKVWVYVLGGAFAGLAGLLQFSRLTSGDPTVAVGLELDAIAAVVIGGGSLSGGEGSVFGTILGALIMATIRAGCSQAGWPNWIQEIVTGVVIVTAVGIDRWRHRAAT